MKNSLWIFFAVNRVQDRKQFVRDLDDPAFADGGFRLLGIVLCQPLKTDIRAVFFTGDQKYIALVGFFIALHPCIGCLVLYD